MSLEQNQTRWMGTAASSENDSGNYTHVSAHGFSAKAFRLNRHTLLLYISENSWDARASASLPQRSCSQRTEYVWQASADMYPVYAAFIIE